MVENKGSDKRFNYIVLLLMLAFAFVTCLPLLYVLANSFSSAKMVNKGAVFLIPREFTLENYAKILSNNAILTGFRNTLFYVFMGTIIQLVLQFTAAYPLSRRDMKGRSAFSFYFSLTMFVSGGMIPTYIVVKGLNMLNTVWAMIIPGCVSVFNVIVIRTFMQSLPWEMQEAARVDGASDIRTFLSIIFPLSKPIIVVMALYYGVGHWNNYFSAMIYLRDRELYPLQLFLREILIQTQISAAMLGEAVDPDSAQAMAQQANEANLIKYCVIVIATVPMMAIYPWLQKFFVKGVMIGSVKG